MLRILAILVAVLSFACGPREEPDVVPLDFGLDVHDATDVIDIPDVPSVDPCRPGPCLASESCGPIVDGGLGSGNGVDDDCDGQVDEICRCTTDRMAPCFPGPSDRRNVGACHDGTMICTELGIWGTCAGAIAPSAERCDGVDNDCNGRVDDGLEGCATSTACPAYGSARPLSDYTLDGHAVAPSATAFAWRVECPREITTCPAPVSATDAMLRVHVVQSGRYLVHLEAVDGNGTTSTCEFPLYVAGGGLRIELDWDPKGGVNSAGVDLDLHVAPIDRTRSAPASWFTVDDCYYATCRAPGGRVVWTTGPTDTRYAPSTDLALCSGAPPPYGDEWRMAGACWNPRLDTDDVSCDPAVSDPLNPAFCFVENVNIDVPPHDVTYRIGVNFYRDHGTCTDADPGDDIAHPRLLVHCAGAINAEIGGVDDGEVSMRCSDNQDLGSSNWTWLAADVRFGTNACGLEDCTVVPLIAGPNAYHPCSSVRDTDDVCMDGSRRVYVRRAGSRPVDADFADSF
jgi:hypothetical protein